MSQINIIAKKCKTEAENIKKTDFDNRYTEHYNTVMLSHLRELDETFNKCVTEMKKKLDEEKTIYVEEQKTIINEQVEAEYTAFFSAIDSFIEKN